ncbi:carbohydrate deacetylase isoform X2 [Numida meleagris]|uniref:carbohydrate deacetylase isoform X2 n=1 Tax=Numida meleagris TaxID=8996 RepID=UPI000B3E2677|nr:carbohydrate deacetylase isoform X2 [Numida meleagris]
MFQAKLIVTGDDFGYCPRRNQGIVECFLAGAVSNVSLLVNGSAAADAAKLARRYNIPIGLHANLSEGSPVCEVLKTNSSLINEDGFFHGKMGFRTALSKGLLNMSEVKQELKAQVDLFHELTGHLPPHMDGHQHVHVLPEVRHVFAEVLEEYGIEYTRVPIEPGLHNCDWIEPSLMDFYVGVEEDSLNTVDVFTKHGISNCCIEELTSNCPLLSMRSVWYGCTSYQQVVKGGNSLYLLSALIPVMKAFELQPTPTVPSLGSSVWNRVRAALLSALPEGEAEAAWTTDSRAAALRGRTGQGGRRHTATTQHSI